MGKAPGRQLAVAKLLGSDAQSRTVRYVLSTASPDRMRDTIDPAGWQLDNYRKNPVLLWGHDKKLPPIGRALDVRVVGSQLEGVYEFAPADVNPFADTVYQLAKAGYLPGGSVGFMPLTYEFNDTTGGIDFKTQELLEFSVVTVPAHPDALIVNYSLMDRISAAEKDFPDAFTELRAALSATKAAPIAASLIGRNKARAAYLANTVRIAR